MAPSSFSLFISLTLLLVFSEASSDRTIVKGIDLDHPVLDLTPYPQPVFASPQGSGDVLLCERAQVTGLSRLKFGSYASAFRVTLAPAVHVPERLHTRIKICFHRNASLGLCQCEKDEWRTLKKGLWISSMSPYERRYIDVKFTDHLSGSVTVTVEEDPHRWRLACLAIGFALLLLAPFVSNWVPFYYSSSMAVGVFLVIIILLFQGMKLLPTGRKSIFNLAIYGSMVGIGSFLMQWFSTFVNAILINLGISEEMHNPVAVFVLVGIVIAGAALGYWIVRRFIVSEDGVVDVGIAQFVKWAMRAVATTFILQSSYDFIMALGAEVACWTICSLIMKLQRSVRKSYSRERTSWALRARHAAAVHNRAEFLSRSPSKSPGKMWTSPKSSYAWPDSPVKGVVAPSYAGKRQSGEQEYYSVFHRTPNRRKFTKREWEEFTRDSTRQAVAELTASPEFTDWVIDHADRIQLLPDDEDSTIGSESDSTNETGVESVSRFHLFKW